MPRLVDSMTHGVVIAWRKQEGEAVRAGEPIAEIEADKTTVDLEAPAAGRLGRILVAGGGEKVPVGEVLAILESAAEAANQEAIPAPSNGTTDGIPAAQNPRQTEIAPSVTDATSSPSPIEADPVQASPLALSMARQAGLDMASVSGRRPDGRIGHLDIYSALGIRDEPVAASPRVSVLTEIESPVNGAPYEDIPHARTRQVIARRLGESKRTIPHFYLEVHCQVDAILRMRSELLTGRTDGLKLTINDFVVRAAALALRRVPEANACWTEAAARRYRRVDLAFAAATSNGLMAPVIRDVDRKGLAEIAGEVRELSRRAREGKLRPEELQGGTFTVSNLGMHGIDSLYAIVNPPQAGILGIGAATQRPVARDGVVAVATVMTCTLSADHRLLDGDVAARFLAEFRGLLEKPIAMAL